jgi:hypothetical protein
MARQRALVLGPWTVTDANAFHAVTGERLPLFLAQLAYDYPCGCKDLSSRAGTELPPDPNWNLWEVRAEPEVMDKIAADPDYVIVWREPDLESRGERAKPPLPVVRAMVRQYLQGKGMAPAAVLALVGQDTDTDLAEQLQVRLKGHNDGLGKGVFGPRRPRKGYYGKLTTTTTGLPTSSTTTGGPGRRII